MSDKVIAIDIASPRVIYLIMHMSQKSLNCIIEANDKGIRILLSFSLLAH